MSRPNRAAEIIELGIPLHVETIASTRPQWKGPAQENLTRLLGIAKGYAADIRAARKDPDLSDAGRVKAAEKAGAKALAAVAEFEKGVIAGIRRHAASVEAEVGNAAVVERPKDPAARLAYELRAREIRDQVRGLDELQRWVVYTSTTDPEIVDALENGPPMVEVRADKSGALPVFVSIVDPERKAAAVLERARSAAPEKAAELEALQQLALVYQRDANVIRANVYDAHPGLHGEADPVVLASEDA